MKVRFTTGIAGAQVSYDTDQVVTVGEVYSHEEIPAAWAEQLLASGIVVPHEEPVATATARPPRERAVARRGGGR